MMLRSLLSPVLAAAAIAACSPSTPADPESADTAGPADATERVLTIYSARHYDSDKLLYAAFEQATGTKVDVREAKADQLLETMRAEGENSPADLVIASDAGALWRFQNAGFTQAITDERLSSIIPETYRDPDGHWFGLARRIRLVAYDPERFEAEQVDSWAKLAEADKDGEICVRASSNIYNLSLMAELIERVGSDAAQDWAGAIVGNMARSPQGGDTDQIRAVAAGECGLAIVNHYYWVRLATSDSESDREAAEATRLIIPSYGDGDGAHVNITGAAVTSTADDPALAADFIDFLLSTVGQELLIVDTKELPLVDGIALPEGVDLVPEVEKSATPLAQFGANQAEAQRLYDLAGWN